MMQNKSAVDDDRVVITITERTVETSDRTLEGNAAAAAVVVIVIVVGIIFGFGVLTGWGIWGWGAKM